MAINPRTIRRLFRHSPVWAPGVKKQIQADLYTNKRIDEHAAALPAKKVLDLGCGAGGIMLDLAISRPDASYAGVTSSRINKQTGDELVLRHGLQEQVRIFEANYLDPRVFRLFPDMDLIYAVESMSSREDPLAAVPYITESLKPGGRFILCDYMLKTEKINKLQSGDDISGAGLRAAPEWIGLLEDAGLETISAEDFTPWIKGISLFATLIPGNKNRGNPLGKLLKQGLLQYRFLVFQKQPG